MDRGRVQPPCGTGGDWHSIGNELPPGLRPLLEFFEVPLRRSVKRLERYFLLGRLAANGYVASMVLATCNKAKRLLVLSYIGQVRRSDLERRRDDLKGLLTEMSPGFRLLVDLTSLESMKLDCTDVIGEFMKLMDQIGVSMVVRVIPDPKKDIGMNILMVFHYKKRPRVVNCQTMKEAAAVLAL